LRKSVLYTVGGQACVLQRVAVCVAADRRLEKVYLVHGRRISVCVAVCCSVLQRATKILL